MICMHFTSKFTYVIRSDMYIATKAGAVLLKILFLKTCRLPLLPGLKLILFAEVTPLQFL